MAFSGLTQADRQLFQDFLQRIEVVDLTSTDAELVEKIIEIRQQFRLKLPDAIVAAMAIQNSAGVVTADRKFAKVNVLTVTNW